MYRTIVVSIVMAAIVELTDLGETLNLKRMDITLVQIIILPKINLLFQSVLFDYVIYEINEVLDQFLTTHIADCSILT